MTQTRQLQTLAFIKNSAATAYKKQPVTKKTERGHYNYWSHLNQPRASEISVDQHHVSILAARASCLPSVLTLRCHHSWALSFVHVLTLTVTVWTALSFHNARYAYMFFRTRCEDKTLHCTDSKEYILKKYDPKDPPSALNAMQSHVLSVAISTCK